VIAADIKTNFLKFIRGGYGLPLTFWVFWVSIGLVLNYGIKYWQLSHAWQFAVVALLQLAHVCLGLLAVWNAAKRYVGLRLWSYLARFVVILNVIQWLLMAPDYIVVLLNASGMDLRSDKYWELHGNPAVCEPALLQLTPESILRKYPGECFAMAGDSGRAVVLDCELSALKSRFIYFLNQNDCTKFIEKVNAAKASS
jgi:hypothetical protein